MNNLIVRPERTSDVAAINTVTEAAFRDVPQSDQSEPRIVAALRRDGQLAVSLVAERAGEVIGHVALSPVTIADGTPGWFGLGPLSVRPEHQRQGIGSRLVNEALTSLRARGAAGCVLVGEPAYYGRFGFQVQPGLVFPDVPPEFFLAVSLGPPIPRGVVTYADAFGGQA